MLDYIARSRHASGPENLELRIVAALTLSSEQSEFASRTSKEIAVAAEAVFPAFSGKVELQKRSDIRSDVSANVEEPISSRGRSQLDTLESPESAPRPVGIVFEAVADNVGAVQTRAQTEIARLRESHKVELQLEREEQERLRQQVRERNAELAANREESRLELRQDMLLAVGEVLQSVHHRNGSGEPAGDVAAGLALALRAGGAEPLGTPGKVVEFDPELHQAEKSAPDRSLVRVVAPGVLYRGGIHGDRVLLKAQVKHEAG